MTITTVHWQCMSSLILPHHSSCHSRAKRVPVAYPSVIPAKAARLSLFICFTQPHNKQHINRGPKISVNISQSESIPVLYRCYSRFVQPYRSCKQEHKTYHINDMWQYDKHMQSHHTSPTKLWINLTMPHKRYTGMHETASRIDNIIPVSHRSTLHSHRSRLALRPLLAPVKHTLHMISPIHAS